MSQDRSIITQQEKRTQESRSRLLTALGIGVTDEAEDTGWAIIEAAFYFVQNRYALAALLAVENDEERGKREMSAALTTYPLDGFGSNDCHRMDRKARAEAYSRVLTFGM